MLICFEGLDGCGKTTLSLLFQQYLNTKFRGSDGLLKLDPHLGDFIWSKEPLFSSEEADAINAPGTDEFYRESVFFESRLKHQDLLSNHNVVCDRYIWCGIAYSRVYSPSAWQMARALYLNDHLFQPADLYIFVDTPIEVCHDRRRDTPMETLQAIRAAYMSTRKDIGSALTVQAVGDENKALDKLIEKFEEYTSINNLGDPLWL